MTATGDDRFEEWAPDFRDSLCEAALRLLAALGPEPFFPAEPAALEALVGRVGEGRPTEPMRFAIQLPGELPRYDGEFGFWIRPAGDGCLGLRQETGRLRSEAVLLRPDGTLGEFESIEGFGVPEEEWTEQARADVAAIERLEREQEAAEPELDRLREEHEQRFQLSNLRGSRAAPAHDSAGPVVTFVSLYTTGVVVNYLVPRPPDEQLESDDPWAEPEFEAALPKIELADDLGTPYELVDFGDFDFNGPLIRASQAFTPRVPEAASRLSVRFESAAVAVELDPR